MLLHIALIFLLMPLMNIYQLKSKSLSPKGRDDKCYSPIQNYQLGRINK